MNFNYRGLFLFVLLMLICIPCRAEDGFMILAFGFGPARAKASSSGIKFDTKNDTYFNCTPGSGDPGCQTTSALKSMFYGFELGGQNAAARNSGGYSINYLVPPRRHYGGGLIFRLHLLDLNIVYLPIQKKYVALKLIGGIGGTFANFSSSSERYLSFITPPGKKYSSSNHLQFHAGIGIEFNVPKHLFIRPQFDFRYITNFSDQFGRNTMVGGTLWIGLKYRVKIVT
jgi:hypothetical protein